MINITITIKSFSYIFKCWFMRKIGWDLSYKIIRKLLPWLVWFSGLNTGLRARRSWVWLPGRAHVWDAGQVPSGGHVKGNHTLMFLSLSFSFPSPLSKNKITSLKKRKIKLFSNICCCSGVEGGIIVICLLISMWFFFFFS